MNARKRTNSFILLFALSLRLAIIPAHIHTDPQTPRLNGADADAVLVWQAKIVPTAII